MQSKLPPSKTPGAIDLDFTGIFNLRELREPPPPPPPPPPAAPTPVAKPRPVPKDIMVGVKALEKDSYFVNMTRPRAMPAPVGLRNSAVPIRCEMPRLRCRAPSPEHRVQRRSMRP